MKTRILTYFTLFFLCIIVLLFCLSASTISDSSNFTNELENLLPKSNELNGWFAQSAFEFAAGQDLYLVINGGAEIYHEYGFTNAIFQTYFDSSGNSINLEIYEMENNAAAFGIYSFKTGKEGIPLKLGFEGWLETYYLNFWKGNYLVTLTSMNTDTSCIDDLINLANAVNKKIMVTSNLPALISFLPEEYLQQNSIKYIKGNLALFNQNIFGPKNIFGLKEGIIGEYTDYLIMIIKYQNSSESNKWHKSAKNYFKTNNSFTEFNENDSHFEISDSKSNRLWIKYFTNFIIIIRGKEIININYLFNSLEEKIKP